MTTTDTHPRADMATGMPNCERFMSREEKRQRVLEDATPRTTVSFYRYVNLTSPDIMQRELYKNLYDLGCLGRIYVAKEGINAQMNVPTARWQEFVDYLNTWDELSDMHFKIAREESAPSFFKLTIKTRNKIVADGLDDSSFDVTNTGEYLTAEEINAYIDDPDAVVIDMRNAYEAEVGHFEGAQIMPVDSFAEQLATVTKQFANQKEKKIALYCTGGIRCEKASAWMKHNGFSDVRHVRGGIIDYDRQVKEEGLDNKFRGKNFVFDERMGERISGEVIATCHLCKDASADTHYHCQYKPCHVLHIACDDCHERMAGYCGRGCQIFDRMPKRVKQIDGRIRAASINKSNQFRKKRLGV